MSSLIIFIKLSSVMPFLQLMIDLFFPKEEDYVDEILDSVMEGFEEEQSSGQDKIDVTLVREFLIFENN